MSDAQEKHSEKERYRLTVDLSEEDHAMLVDLQSVQPMPFTMIMRLLVRSAHAALQEKRKRIR
jgi:hypothetical protein